MTTIAEILPPLPVTPIITLYVNVAGFCRCAVLGDPLVVFYDKYGVAILLENGIYTISAVARDVDLYPCSFQLEVETYRPYNNTQLTVLKGVQMKLFQDALSTTVISEGGVLVGTKRSLLDRRYPWTKYSV